jgi:hypothetical protein
MPTAKLRAHYFVGLAFRAPEDETGLPILDVAAYSPAARTKLRPGDVLMELGDRAIESAVDVQAGLRRTNQLVVRRGHRRLTYACRAVNLSSAREALGLLRGDREKLYKTKWKSSCKCSDGNCVDGSMWAWCREYYTMEGDGPHEGVMLLRRCEQDNIDTHTHRDEPDPAGPKEFF